MSWGMLADTTSAGSAGQAPRSIFCCSRSFEFCNFARKMIPNVRFEKSFVKVFAEHSYQIAWIWISVWASFSFSCNCYEPRHKKQRPRPPHPPPKRDISQVFWRKLPWLCSHKCDKGSYAQLSIQFRRFASVWTGPRYQKGLRWANGVQTKEVEQQILLK